MSARSIRVFVVDDSAVIRQIICDHVSAAPGMEVAGTAGDGQQALDLLDVLDPDVVTLDIQMPRLDGLATLDAILARRPLPVIMVSSLTRLGADITLDALDRGALDYVAKPDGGANAASALGDELLRKIRSAAGTDVRRILEIRRERKRRRAEQAASEPPRKNLAEDGSAELADKCIAIGISTGGPPALGSLFENVRPPMPPIVVVQHMPAQFTRPLAWRLDALSRLSIQEAQNGDLLQPNHVLIAPGGRHLALRPAGRTGKVELSDGPPVSGHRPSVDVMMQSAAALFGSRCLGVIMTGMGRDGADGCKAIRHSGGYVLGQDQSSSDVYGMNKVAHVEGNVDRQFSLEQAAQVITLQVKRLWQCLGETRVRGQGLGARD
jgi:two-component system chemotaxis response regulator CheB